MKISSLMHLFFALLLCLCVKAHAFSVEHWKGHPIPIHVKTAQEILIHFPYRIQVKLPTQLKQQAVFINNHQSLLIKPLQDFGDTLLEVSLMNTAHDVILISLSASAQGDVEDIEIDLSSQERSVSERRIEYGVVQESNLYVPAPHLMVQQASVFLQQLEKNEVLSQEGEMTRLPMQTRRYVNLYPNPHIHTTPMGMWSAGSQHIIVVRMQNRGEVPIELDPTLFHGNWRHIIFKFQAERYLLGSYSSDHNATYVILISDHSFRDALEEEAAPHA